MISNSEQDKIYCANCLHCKIIPTPAEEGEGCVLRVRCARGMWKKRLGEEKIYKYFTVTRRSIESCPHYEAMGEVSEFLRNLKDSLPLKDEIYDPLTLQTLPEDQ